MMDKEALERLLTDLAVGELSDDVRDLLSAYLAKDPPAAQLARELQETAHLARRALAAPPPAPAKLPAFPAERLREAQRPRARRLAWPGSVGRGLALAASGVLGLGVGWLMFRHPGAGAPVGEPRVIVRVVERGAPPGGAAEIEKRTPPDDSGFWSAGMLAKRSAGRRRVDSARLMWTSPVEMPTIGGG